MRHTSTTAPASPIQPGPATAMSRIRATPRRIGITAAALSALLLASCTSDPPARPSDDADHRRGTSTTTTTVPVPYLPGSEADAEAYRALRRLDPCALLDPEAGARAVGGTADQLVPGPDPAECTLDVLPEGAKSSVDAWTVTAEVGVSFDDSDSELGGAKPQSIPNAPDNSFYQEESYSGSDCTIVRPLDSQYGDGYGIELEVQAPILAETPSQPPCDVAARYLESTTDRWLQPATRSDKLTEPRLPLAEQDPCAATTAIGDALGKEVRATPDTLYTCRIVITGPAGDTTDHPTGTAPVTPRTPSDTAPTKPTGPASGDPSGSEASVEVRFTITGDPASREPSNGIEPVTIAGHGGSLDRSLTDKCVVQIATTDTITVDTRDGESVQVIGVMAPSCETARQLAATVVETVTHR